jgi:hypothetical protein
MALPMVSEALWRTRAVCSDMVCQEAVKALAYQIRGDRPSRSWRWSSMCMPAPIPMMNNDLPLIYIYWLPAHLKELGGLASISHAGN